MFYISRYVTARIVVRIEMNKARVEKQESHESDKENLAYPKCHMT